MLNTVVNSTRESNNQLSGPCLQNVDFEKGPYSNQICLLPIQSLHIEQEGKGLLNQFAKGILSFDTFVTQYMLTSTIFSSSPIQNLDKPYITSLPNRDTFRNLLTTIIQHLVRYERSCYSKKKSIYRNVQNRLWLR